jgi:hypothetical protein
MVPDGARAAERDAIGFCKLLSSQGVIAQGAGVARVESIGDWIAFCGFMRRPENRSTALPVPSSSTGIDQHFETEKRAVWDEVKRIFEERELVYEVSWLPERGIWRRFLRTHRRA